LLSNANEAMRKNDNLDVVAAVLAQTYLLKANDVEKNDFNSLDLYVNTYLRMKARLVNMLDD